MGVAMADHPTLLLAAMPQPQQVPPGASRLPANSISAAAQVKPPGRPAPAQASSSDRASLIKSSSRPRGRPASAAPALAHNTDHDQSQRYQYQSAGRSASHAAATFIASESAANFQDNHHGNLESALDLSDEDDDQHTRVDYQDAAAALEQIFHGSPSLPDQLKRRRRKDLTARISLRKKRIKKIRTSSSLSAAQPRPLASDRHELQDQSDVWSPSVDQLIRDYGVDFRVSALNWSNVGHDLLNAAEEHWLSSLMKPFKTVQKVRSSLQRQLGREPSDEEWARAAKVDLPLLRRHLIVHEAARNKLVQLNLRLVLHLARKYYREGSSLTILDLCQEGVKGLIMAVDRFEPSKGCRFSTYSVFWIRNSILRAQIRSGYPVRAPFRFSEVRMNLKKIREEMEESGEVSEEELMRRAGLDKETYMAVMRAGKLRLTSLHQRNRTTGHELIDSLPDQPSSNSSIAVVDPMLRLGIDEVLDSLKPKESLVLRQRFGLDGKGERALGEIGRNLRMSREMARRYEAQGLLKLQHPTRLSYLRSFLSSET